MYDTFWFYEVYNLDFSTVLIFNISILDRKFKSRADRYVAIITKAESSIILLVIPHMKNGPIIKA